MSLEVELETGESLIFEDRYGHAKRPTVLAVTDRAVFVTREKHFAKESWYLDRIPIASVTQLSLEPERPVVLWGISLLIFFGGLALAAGMAINVYRGLVGTKISPWPIAFMLIGAAMPFAGRGRKILVVQYGKDRFRWKPGFLDDKHKIKAMQEGFIEASRRVGIHIYRQFSQ